ncbi:hypothetical protein Vi05172_g10079 [Venturia inaequalis]|nr:hypothetical protein Vi05172_g10079 [Venturia inaequalis]
MVTFSLEAHTNSTSNSTKLHSIIVMSSSKTAPRPTFAALPLYLTFTKRIKFETRLPRGPYSTISS